MKFHSGLLGCDAFCAIIFKSKECKNIFEYFPLQMKATRFFETSASTHSTSQRHISEDLKPEQHLHNNLKSRKLNFKLKVDFCIIGQLKCDGTRAETRFRLSAKRTSLFKSAGASVQSTAGRRVVRISGSNAGYTMFRGSVKGTGYPLHSPFSPSFLVPYVTVCHHISNVVYLFT